MRRITKIVIHHSASPLTTRAGEIDGWHRAKGWDGIGYHYVIEADGKLVLGRPVEKIGAHCKGWNTNSIGVCVVGDNTKPMRAWTMQQWLALYELVAVLQSDYPEAKIRGHRDLAPTECPGFHNVAGLLEAFGPFALRMQNAG